jgi:16S rRNA (guanine966-N2)-methyltransferase
MRVIAGDLGGRRLRAPKSDAIRPTGDRVREALFSILGDIEGLEVLDLYCGTGSLGIEAISRGALAATFVDLDSRPAERNVSDLGIEPQATLIRSDALRFLEREPGSFDLVLCDPPYKLARRLGPELDRLLPPRLSGDARVILETAADDTMELSLPLIDDRTYGSSRIRIHEVGAR